MKRMMTWMGLFAMAVTMVSLHCLAEEEKGKADEPQETVKQAADAEITPRAQAARVRGKILYKRSQIRKLEQEVCEKKAELKAKVGELEQERRTQYIAAEPKLQELYAELDALETALAKIPVEKGKRNP